MVCQDAGSVDFGPGINISNALHSPPVKTPTRIRSTNPFLPNYYAGNGTSETQDTLTTALWNTNVHRDRCTVTDSSATTARTTVQPAASTPVCSTKPMAKVLPQRREIVSKPYPTTSPQDSSLLNPRHQRPISSRSVLRETNNNTPHTMGPMSSPMAVLKKPASEMSDKRALLSELATQIDQQIGQYYNNACTLTTAPPSPTFHRHLNSLPENFNMVIDEYSKVCGYDASSDANLKRAYHLLAEAHCYYGNLSMEDARAKLRPMAEGTFLLRDSSDPRFLFSLSVKTKRGVTAVRIAYDSLSGNFTLDCERDMALRMPVFSCILVLLQFYTQLTRATRHRNNGMCVFLESSGRRDTAVVLSHPLVHSVAPLKCLARKKLNAMLSEEQRRKLLLFMPPRIEQFMKDYPYRI